MKHLHRATCATLAIVLAGAMLFAGCTASTETEADTAADTTAQTTDVAADTTDTEGSDTAEAATRIFTDSLGREVEVPTEITTVAVTGQLGQIVMLSVAPDLLIGIATEWDETAALYLDEAYYNLPVIGQWYSSNGEVSLEELLLLNPDIVIDIGESSSDLMEELDLMYERTGIPFVHIESTLTTTSEMYTNLGDLLGREADAQVLSDYCATVYANTEALLATVGDERAQLVYCLGDDGTNVLGAGSYHTEILDMVADNLAVLENPSSKGTGDSVGFEQLLVWDPDILIFAPDSVYDEVADSELWNQLTAVQNGTYYEVPYGPYNWMGMPPSIQRYLGLLWISEVLYPELSETDLQAAVTEYYALFYHCELTDEMYDALMENSL